MISNAKHATAMIPRMTSVILHVLHGQSLEPQSWQDEFEDLENVLWHHHREAAEVAVLPVAADDLLVERLEALPATRGLTAHTHHDDTLVQVARFYPSLAKVADKKLVVCGNVVSKLVEPQLAEQLAPQGIRMMRCQIPL